MMRVVRHKMKTIITILLATATVALAQREDMIPGGRLGFPLGTYLTVTGTRPEGPKFKTNPWTSLLVTEANGKKIDPPIMIEVENLGASYFPSNTTVIIRGYETGKMVGVPFEVAQKENIPVPQVGWHFRRTFVFTSSVTPPKLPKKTDDYIHRREQRGKNVEPPLSP